jgi:O-antigen/teichoic acid export membrane protein
MRRAAEPPSEAATSRVDAPASVEEPPGAEQAVSGMFGRDTLYAVMWGVQLATAALFTPVTTRVLGASEFGRAAAAVAVMQVLFAVVVMSLQPALQKVFAEPDGDRKARKILMLAVLCAVTMTSLADVTGPVWSGWLGFESYEGAVRVAVWWAGTAAVTDAGLALLRCRDRLLRFSTVSLLQSVAAEAASLLLVVYVAGTASMFLLGHLLMQALACAYCLMSAPPARIRIADETLARRALRYALPLLPAALAAFALNASDRFVIQRSLGPIEVGRYQVAYNIGSLAVPLLGALSSVWMPRVFAIADRSTRAYVLGAARDGVYRVLLPVVVGLTVGAPALLRVWTPPSYRPDELLLVVAVVAMSAIPYAGGLAHGRVLLVEGRTAPLALSIVLAGTLNVVLNLLLVPHLHLLGAAIATFLSFALVTVLNGRYARKVLTLPRVPARLTAAMAGWSSLALASVLLPTTPAWLALRLLAGVVCLAWFAAVFRRTGRVGRS